MAKTFKTGDLLPAITKQITQERIAGWAELSGDFNRLHVDPAYARETRFGGTIAHGPMSLAFLNELMMSCFGLLWAKGGRLQDVRFLAPIRPGDLIVIGGKVEQVQEAGNRNTLHCRLEISKDGGETTAVSGLGVIPLNEAKK